MNMTSTPTSTLKIIGSTVYVEIFGVKNVPAKIDTGADTSAIWASNIDVDENGTLSFSLFNEKSPFYTGKKIETSDSLAKRVRSSHGDVQIRYRVKLPIIVKGESFTTTFTLANRSRNHFPILIGRHTLENRFLVDVSKTDIDRPVGRKSIRLNKEFHDDPHAFHQKYFSKGAI